MVVRGPISLFTVLMFLDVKEPCADARWSLARMAGPANDNAGHETRRSTLKLRE